MAKVVLDKVTKIFDKNVVAVDAVDIDIKDTEFVVLVGPSGCGKSTTLRMIAGLEDISSGEISIDDRIVNDVPPKDRDIAMVFQNYALYPHMSVFENMAFGLKLRRYPKDEIEKRVQEAAHILGIQPLLSRKPKALSGGQRQRVAVGRAIVRKPKVFLFDEPLSNLDAKLRVQMRTEISKLHSRLETTMIYVTHDQVEAMTMGDRIVVMKDGKVQQIDSPLSLYSAPVNKFVAGFIGSPAMNFLEGKLVQGDGLYFNSSSLQLLLTSTVAKKLQPFIDQPLIIGIRPEDIIEAVQETVEKNYAVMQCKVEVVEPMGNEQFVYLKIGQDSLVARMNTLARPKVNMDYQVAFNWDRVHFFDAQSEVVIN
ncbi:sn-glycerol-3-phosphate ABC transporter ATP-binding protein UgpC [candidate division KSB1 bacterium]|nr:sn-glycerol-3-phosphate ABC transporter ATP-binding protein UgpC [candidate division KSB1 bacterium]